MRLQLARLGASLDFTVGREVAVFRFAVPTRNTAALLRLLADLLARRGLSEEDWREAVARRGDGLLLEQSDPWQRATARLTGQAWRETAVAAALPAAPGREALASFRARAYAPGRMVLSVWGELPTAAVAEAVRRELGRLPAGAGEPAADAPPEPARNPGGGVSCLRDEGAVPPALLVGVGAEVESDLTFYGWQVAAHILGASHNSRLQQRLRTETQVVYTVEAACVPVGSRGLTLRIACQTDQVETARAVVLDELRRLTREPVAQAELDLARAILRSRLELDRGSFRDRFYQRSLALLAVPLARNPAAAEEILAGLTPAALHDLLRRTLRPDDAATVVVSAHDESLCEAANGPAGR